MDNKQLRKDMSNFLMYRYLYDGKNAWDEKHPARRSELIENRTPICTADELIASLKEQVEQAASDGKAALALSGGIDSAVLARFMPKGSYAYTFRCVVPGIQVADESKQASAYAEACGLKHIVIDIDWEDILAHMDELILHKGAPIHSIETEIFQIATKAKNDGFTKLIFGENADIIYGGMDGLISKDWKACEFIERYSYVMPHRVMYQPEMDFRPFYKYEKDGCIDAHRFINEYFRQEACGSYENSCTVAGVERVIPYAHTVLGIPIDLNRIRSGDTKYLIREAFRKLYPGFNIPVKVPMPRATNEWLAHWDGPKRKEFFPHCAEGLKGDQKWMLFSLERYMDLIGAEDQ